MVIIFDSAYGSAGENITRETSYLSTFMTIPHLFNSLRASYYRISLVSVGCTLTGEIETVMTKDVVQPVTALGDRLQYGQTAPVTRAAIMGRSRDGYRDMAIERDSSLGVTIKNPTTAFGAVITAETTHILQIKFTYLLHSQIVDQILNPPLRLDLTTPGADGTAQVVTVYLPAADTFTAGDYIILYEHTPTAILVWFKVAAESAPTIKVPGSTVANIATAIEVDISGDTTAIEVAARFATAVGGNANFAAAQTSGTNVVVVTNATAGASAPPVVRPNKFPISAGNSGTISSAAVDNNELLLTMAAQRYASAVLQSHRLLVYRPGQSNMTRYTAKFMPPVIGVDQFAGVGNSSGGLYFVVDYLTGAFGIDHRYGGAPEIRTLTITTGFGATTPAIVTLDGVATEIPVTHTGSSTGLTAAEIASHDYSHVEFEAYNEGSTVIFISTRIDLVEGPRTGTYAIAVGDGADNAIGSWARTQAGTAQSRNFTPMSSWNLRRFEAETQESDYILDPTKGNVFQIVWPWHGYGNPMFYLSHPDFAGVEPVHMISYANANTSPSIPHPNVYLRWGIRDYSSASLGTRELRSASGTLSVHGPIHRNTPNGSVTSAELAPNTINGTREILMAIRVPRVFKGKEAECEIQLTSASGANDANKMITCEGILNPTITDPDLMNFAYENSESCVQTWKAAANNITTFSGGIAGVLSVPVPANSSISKNLLDREVILSPGDLLLITMSRIDSSTGGGVKLTLNWVEDL